MATDENEAAMLVRAVGETWREPSQVGYLSEADMQQMLAEQPSLIPGVSQRALATREFHTGVGPSDVIVVDQDGSVTVVECKLSSNAEVRRKIIGQVLDYASRLWRMPLTDFEARWKACSGGSGVVDLLEEQAATDLTTALNDGAFRLVLAVDEINDDLRRIVEYLNAHTNDQVTVLAVELRRVSHGGVDILTPRTFGQELARTKDAKTRADKRPAWTIEQVRAALKDVDPQICEVYDRLSVGLLGLGCTTQGTAAATPSMIFKLQMPNGLVAWPLAVYTARKPTVQVNFQWLPEGAPAQRAAFLDALAAPPTSLAADLVRESGFKKRPSVDLSRLIDEPVMRQFMEAVRHLTDPVRSPDG